MNNLPNNQYNNYDDEIDLQELFRALWDKKFYIIAVTTIFTLISIMYALMLPNIYKSEAMLMPIETNSGMTNMLGRYSGMASMAGISIPAESGSKAQEAIARIQSFEFFSNNFLPHIAIENLLAVKNWNQSTNTLAYNESTFNSDTRQWMQNDIPVKSYTPSSQKAYNKYKAIMKVSQDKKTLFVNISIQHESPFIARKWVEIVIGQIDQVMRDQDKQTAMKSVEYLNGVAATVNYEEIRKALSLLQQEQMKRLMMIEASENYTFKVLDSPIAPEIKSAPSRSFIVILGAMLGIALGVLGALVFNYIRRTS